MARLPSTVTIRHLVDSLRALGEAPERGKPRRIDDLEARLTRAVERDLAGVATRDGYATATITGGRRGAVVAVEADEHGPVEHLPATSVEAAVVARAERARDDHHVHTVAAVRAVDEAVVAVQRAFAHLASIDDLTKTAPPAPRTCDHCTNKRGQGGNRPVYVRGTVGDRLERPIALCEACHSFVRQTAAAGSRAGYLPDGRQISDHEDRGRWRIHVNEQARREEARSHAADPPDHGHGAAPDQPGRGDHDEHA